MRRLVGLALLALSFPCLAADGIIEVKMHQFSDVDVQRRIRVVKMRGSNHRTGFNALVFEDARFQVTRVISP